MDHVSTFPDPFLCLRLKCQVFPSYKISASLAMGGCAASTLLRCMFRIHVPENGGTFAFWAQPKELDSKSPSARKLTVFMAEHSRIAAIDSQLLPLVFFLLHEDQFRL